MLMPMQIICLRTTRYSDTHAILSAYSRQGGRVSFLVPAGNGREAGRRRAVLMPLSVVDCVADIRPGREIHGMREPRSSVPMHSVRANPIKNAMAAFMAEFLGMVLREGQSDAALFEFVLSSVRVLESVEAKRLANFHICFLLKIGLFIGIEPDWGSYASGRVFDMVDSVYRAGVPLHGHFLTPSESEAAYKISRICYRNMHLFVMNRRMRRQVLDFILQYYSLHYAGMGGLKSLDVLAALF